MSLNRDENKITVYGGLNSSDLLSVLPLKVDPVTGRLLVGIDVCVDASMPPTKPTFLDENRINVNSAVIDDANAETATLTVCADNQGLNIDLLIE